MPNGLVKELSGCVVKSCHTSGVSVIYCFVSKPVQRQSHPDGKTTTRHHHAANHDADIKISPNALEMAHGLVRSVNSDRK
jgi:hypothetical protein